MSNVRRSTRGSAGFTLIEALVAFTLLALVLPAIYGALGGASSSTHAASRTLAALARAEAALEEAKSHDLAPGESDRTAGDWREHVVVTETDLPGLLRIEARITPAGDTRDRGVSLATLFPARAR